MRRRRSDMARDNQMRIQRGPRGSSAVVAPAVLRTVMRPRREDAPYVIARLTKNPYPSELIEVIW